MKRRLASLAFVVAAAGTALGLAASAALADTTVTLTYPVTGSTFIAAPNATVDLGPGTLTSSVDLTAGTLTGNLTLPAATGSFNELGLVPVSATTEFIQQGQTTGTINTTTGAVTATSYITIRITSLTVSGIPVPPGPFCQTVVPAQITVTSQAGWSPFRGGVLAGSYSIPLFNNCGLLNAETPVINATLPGPGNTISLTLGTPTSGG